MSANNHAQNELSQIPRFLCDRMLAALARWLRAAGYDAAIGAPDARDRDLFDQAVAEGRFLVSSDRKLGEFREAPSRLVLLAGNGGLRDQAQEMTALLHLNWLHRPFTRCLVCNTPLEAAPPARWQDVPKRSRLGGDLHLCPRCDRLCWEGGHVRRMRARLQRWQGGYFDDPP